MNTYALVTYLPGALGAFLDGLRVELEGRPVAQAHVTLLPPRPLLDSPEAAWEQLQSVLDQFPPFDVELLDVEVFPVSNVVYIDIGLGRQPLREMHTVLNHGVLSFVEPFQYHPHVTLAQDFSAAVDDVAGRARGRWADFHGARGFSVESLTLVQNRGGNDWVDLASHSLGAQREPLLRS